MTFLKDAFSEMQRGKKNFLNISAAAEAFTAGGGWDLVFSRGEGTAEGTAEKNQSGQGPAGAYPPRSYLVN